MPTHGPRRRGALARNEVAHLALDRTADRFPHEFLGRAQQRAPGLVIRFLVHRPPHFVAVGRVASVGTAKGGANLGVVQRPITRGDLAHHVYAQSRNEVLTGSLVVGGVGQNGMPALAAYHGQSSDGFVELPS